MFDSSERMALIKLFGACTAMMFLFLIVGVPDFEHGKAVTSLFMVITAALAFDNEDLEYCIAGVMIAIFINPFFPFLSLPRHIWVLFDIFCIVGILYYIFRTTNPYQKGIRFESYVETLFPSEKFALVDKTRDTSKSSGRRVESDSNPDFVFRSKSSGREFAVECKWRANWYSRHGKLGIIWDLRKQDSYLRFSQKKLIPVFIAFGIGGKPDNPHEVHFLEVTKTVYPFLWKKLITSGVKVLEV